MLTAETLLISVDDHVIEPPGVFVDHIAPRYREQAPRIVEPEPGVQGWEWEVASIRCSSRGTCTRAGSAPAKRARATDLFARHYDDMIPAAYDVHERVRAMDEDGVWAELLFPTFRASAATASSKPTTRTSRSRACRRGTTGCSTSGAPRTPIGSFPRR